MLGTIEINSISKIEFLKCKICEKQYKDFGNFSKHLIKFHNTNLNNYWYDFHYEILPICLETFEKHNNRVNGYWNKFFVVSKEHKKILKAISSLNNSKFLNASENEYFSEYLTFEFWLEKKYKISDIIKKIRFLIKGDTEYYKRLLDNWYDDSWKSYDAIKEYQEEILYGTPRRLIDKNYYNGLVARGWTLEEAKEKLKEHFEIKPTVFRKEGFNTIQNKKMREKYKDLREINCKSLVYWMKKGVSEDDAKKIISDSQKTFSLKICIDKYGYNKGFEVWKARQEKWQKTLNSKPLDEILEINKRKDSISMSHCLKKFDNDIELAENYYYERIKKSLINSFGKASKASLKVFIPIYKFLRQKGIQREDIFLGVNGSKEYFLYDKNDKKIKFYDFTILSKKIIIEFNGDYFHSKESQIFNDKYKKELAIKNGFKILYIYEKDKKNVNLQKIKEFLYDKI